MQTSLQETFAEVRARLQQEPSAQAFEEVITLVLDAERVDPSGVAEVLAPYVRDHLERWYAAAPAGASWSLEWWEWGFEDALGLSGELGERMLRQGSALLPALRALYCNDLEDETRLVSEIARGQLRGLRALRVVRAPDIGALIRTIAAPGVLPRLEALALRGLESKGFSFSGLPDGSLSDLPREDTMPRLRGMCLINCDLDWARLDGLLRWGSMRHVEQLMLAMNTLDDAGLGELLGHPNAARLRGLDVSSNDLTGDGFTLEMMGQMTRLEELMMWGHTLSDAAITALAAPQWPALRVLDLNDNALTAQQLEPLLTSPERRPSLEKLDLSHNALGDDGLALLLAHMPPALRELKLYKCELTVEGMRMLAGCEAMRQLTSIMVTDQTFGEGLALLRASANTAHLFEEA